MGRGFRKPILRRLEKLIPYMDLNEEVDEIIGSVGRWRDFDRSFLPARASVGQRWKRIDRAFQKGEDMPPVELYEIGDTYFVVDGHHRVSVARYHDVPTLEAAVVEFHPKLPAAPVPTISNSELTA